MEPEDRAQGEPPMPRRPPATSSSRDAHVHTDFAVNDRVASTTTTRSATASTRPDGGRSLELDVMTYGATEGVMETLGARVRFDGDESESAGWAPYTLLEPVGDEA